MNASPFRAGVQGGAPGRPALRVMSRAAVYGIVLMWCLFSVFVYSHFSQLGDSESYLAGVYNESGQARTQFISMLSVFVRSLTGSDLVTHLVFALFTASGLAYLVESAKVHGRYRWILCLILLNPNFGIWAAVVGRESVFVGFLGFFMGSVVGLTGGRSCSRAFILVVSAAGMVFIRDAYGVGMVLFMLVFAAQRWGLRIRMGVGVQLLLLVLVAALISVILADQASAYLATDILPKARSYFTLGSATTRTWVRINDAGDYFASLWWSVPLALIGPTIGETLSRPIMFPFFLSGLIAFGTLVFAVRAALRARGAGYRKLLLIGWLPAIGFIVASYVPFGVYNPGSGIRYSSCFLLFFLMPWMLASAQEWRALQDAGVGPVNRGDGQ
jgi:hypothetical protein